MADAVKKNPLELKDYLNIGGSLIEGVGGYLGAREQAKAQEKAARIQAQSMREALDFQKEKHGQVKQAVDPFIGAGTRGLSEYEKLIGAQVQPEYGYKLTDFAYNRYEDPAAKMAMDNARRSLEASALSKGGIGGGTLRALNQEIQNKSLDAYKDAYNRYFDMERYKSNLADNAYNRDYTFGRNKIGDFQNLSNIGAQGVSTLAGVNTNFSQQGSDLLSGMGAVMGAGTIGAGESSRDAYKNLFTGISKGIGAYTGANEDSEWRSQILQLLKEKK